MGSKKWGRRNRGDATPEPSPAPVAAPSAGEVTDDDANAWWTGHGEPAGTDAGLDSQLGPKTADEIREAFKRKKRRPEPEAKPHGAFADYYSADSLFTTVNNDSVDPGAFDPDDPYVALGVPASASWEQIVSAHRRLAKLHHPDRLLDASAEDQELSANRMAEINLAYAELRKRRIV
ncbi:MAG TPA: J domain-containing protein [Acidimicrobiales bacterium]|nr:J domain-containing protein [Acidimicrobiales bacterium]